MKKKKNNFMTEFTLLSLIAVLIMLAYTIKFVDTQDQRIKQLEIENIKLNDLWGDLSVPAKQQSVIKNETVFALSI